LLSWKLDHKQCSMDLANDKSAVTEALQGMALSLKTDHSIKLRFHVQRLVH